MRRTPLRKKRKGSLKNKCWDVFSKHIRLKYADETGMVKCVSCESVKHWKEMDAGHYIPSSISLALRHHEKNVHPQCTSCNRFRHGNLTQYALALKKLYGENILDELDTIRIEGQGMKLCESDFREMIEKYSSKKEGHENDN